MTYWPGNRVSKFNAVRTEIDGIKFASRREAKRYQELKLLERAGLIVCLELQPKFMLQINSVPICTYIGDFLYLDENGKQVVEDAKGFKTPEYKIKKKLMKAIYGIEIREV